MMYKIKNISRNLIISGLFPGKEKTVASLTPKIYKLEKEGLLIVKKVEQKQQRIVKETQKNIKELEIKEETMKEEVSE